MVGKSLASMTISEQHGSGIPCVRCRSDVYVVTQAWLMILSAKDMNTQYGDDCGQEACENEHSPVSEVDCSSYLGTWCPENKSMRDPPSEHNE